MPSHYSKMSEIGVIFPTSSGVTSAARWNLKAGENFNIVDHYI